MKVKIENLERNNQEYIESYQHQGDHVNLTTPSPFIPPAYRSIFPSTFSISKGLEYTLKLILCIPGACKLHFPNAICMYLVCKE